jgi:hypothetical protein
MEAGLADWIDRVVEPMPDGLVLLDEHHARLDLVDRFDLWLYETGAIDQVTALVRHVAALDADDSDREEWLVLVRAALGAQLRHDRRREVASPETPSVHRWLHARRCPKCRALRGLLRWIPECGCPHCLDQVIEILTMRLDPVGMAVDGMNLIERGHPAGRRLIVAALDRMPDMSHQLEADLMQYLLAPAGSRQQATCPSRYCDCELFMQDRK